MAYSHPRVQACMLGCVLFLTVGMYNVITFLGGAGQQTAYLSDVANIALYTVFTVSCLVAPACLNYFGLRATLCFGGFGWALFFDVQRNLLTVMNRYAAYASSLWCFNHTGNTGFVIFGGTFSPIAIFYSHWNIACLTITYRCLVWAFGGIFVGCRRDGNHFVCFGR